MKKEEQWTDRQIYDDGLDLTDVGDLDPLALLYSKKVTAWYLGSDICTQNGGAAFADWFNSGLWEREKNYALFLWFEAQVGSTTNKYLDQTDEENELTEAQKKKYNRILRKIFEKNYKVEV